MVGLFCCNTKTAPVDPDGGCGVSGGLADAAVRGEAHDISQGVADALIEKIGEEGGGAVLEEVERKDGEDHEGDGVGDEWVDGVAHVDDGVDRQAVNAGVHWQHDVGVEEDVDDADDEGGNDKGDEGAFFGVLASVDEGRGEDEDHAADEVGEVADAEGGGTLEDELEHDLYEDDAAAGDGAEEEAGEEGRQFGDVELIEPGHEWQREAQQHEHAGERAEDADEGDGLDRGLTLGHGRFSFLTGEQKMSPGHRKIPGT